MQGKSVSRLISVVSQTIESLGVEPDAKILVAMSGGGDSVCLAHILKELGCSIALAHVNYDLRGKESKSEQTLVEAFAKRWQIPLFIHSSSPTALAEVNPSLQIAAREVRYAFFEKLMDEEGFPYCATGHHADDQVESMLMSLIKGSPYRVMNGIPIKRGGFIRPLLEISKENIRGYLEVHQLAFANDSSNAKLIYTRNRIRNEVVPLLERENPRFKGRILEKYLSYELDQSFISQALEAYLPKEGELNWTNFLKKFDPVFLPILVKETLKRWGVPLNYSYSILNLIQAQKGKQCIFSTQRIIRTGEGLKIAPLPIKQPKVYLRKEEIEKGVAFLEDFIMVSLAITKSPEIDFEDSNTWYMDAEKISFPIGLRGWEVGDKMQPLGMKGSKKLSDIFIDQKLNRVEKEKVIVFHDQEKIIAVSGFRISERVKVERESKSIVEIRVKREMNNDE